MFEKCVDFYLILVTIKTSSVLKDQLLYLLLTDEVLSNEVSYDGNFTMLQKSKRRKQKKTVMITMVASNYGVFMALSVDWTPTSHDGSLTGHQVVRKH